MRLPTKNSNRVLFAPNQFLSMNKLLGILTAIGFAFSLNAQTNYASLVNPFVGTGGHGHTFPGAVVPFGMVQLSPDTRVDGSWDGCSGYHYSDSIIYGFSHTHLSGTGVSDWGDVLLMPMMGKVSLNRDEYASTFNHQNESASPGYYKVLLNDDSITAELTATTRVGMHKYTFAKSGNAFIILDLLHRDQLLESKIEIATNGKTRITGFRRSKAWAQNQFVFYCIEFSKPFKKNKIQSANNQQTQSWFEFDVQKGEAILVKVAISSVDERGAINNLLTELPNWNFTQTKQQAETAWNSELARIEAKGGSDNERAIFYTALYHCFIHPSTASDVDGRYRGRDFKIDTAVGFTYYSVFSLWDTFRALHPLFNLIQKERNLDFVKTMLVQYQASKRLPMWELSSNETNCMIGYHGVSVIADAYAKGIRGFDEELAAKACIDAAQYAEWNIPTFLTKGYLEIEDEHESVSKTLEYAYDNWCIATYLKQTNQFPAFQKIAMKSAGNWIHLYDTKTGFFRPRSNGGWLYPFNPYEVNNHYTEANAWQYSFFVPHQPQALSRLMYTRTLESQLDSLFNASSKINGRQQADITGLIGQYAHGNEPSHHFIYLYGLVGAQAKMAQYVNKVMTELYSTKPDGLTGNEDCGQMSAWYVFSAMGFYPICPGKNEYVINTSIFEEVKLEQKILNINELPKASFIDENKVGIAAPIIESQSVVFSNQQMIVIYNPNNETNLHIQIRDHNQRLVLDSIVSTPSCSLRLHQSSTVSATSFNGGDSATAVAKFILKPNNYEVKLLSKPNKQYTAGGSNALVDGINGNLNWRLGNWMGFQYEHAEAIIDLKETRNIKGVSSSYLQDSRSWILLPTSVEVSYSIDGVQFSKSVSISVKDRAQDETVFTELITNQFNQPVPARFIKFKAINYGNLPKWHQGNGDGAFIFIDEIKILTAE
jgi:predicted alpha-1,2-mannosidase